MTNFVKTLGCLWMWVFFLGSGSIWASGPSTGWKAGVARVDTTPTAPVRMAGYASRTSPSQGVAHPLVTKALALENAKKGITVNVVCPGYIDTEMVAAVPEKVLEGIIATIPVGRLGKAEEIAACVAFLAGPDAGFITGATLTANGGQYITG